MTYRTTVGITIGAGMDLVLVEHTEAGTEHIVLQRGVGIDTIRMNLGLATKARIEDIQSHLERLKVHCR